MNCLGKRKQKLQPETHQTQKFQSETLTQFWLIGQFGRLLLANHVAKVFGGWRIEEVGERVDNALLQVAFHSAAAAAFPVFLAHFHIVLIIIKVGGFIVKGHARNALWILKEFFPSFVFSFDYCMFQTHIYAHLPAALLPPHPRRSSQFGAGPPPPSTLNEELPKWS